MWTLVGMAVVFVAAVRSSSYALWLWEQGERWPATGVLLLTLLSLAIPTYAAVASNP